MGCFPNNTNKAQDIISKPIEKQENIEKIEDFKITEGLLVQETKADPHTLYDEVSILGEGAFGKVIKVRHKISKVTRAMKLIQKDKAGMGGEEEAALINEINVVKSLDHPNIMKVYEYFNIDNYLFIVSELCTGGELFDKIKANKCLSEKVAGYIMKQLLSAVEFCHENNIIHRDLKPENILIESEEEAKKEYFTIKVIDFGTSDKLAKGKMFKQQIGTPLYIAPEVLNNNYNEKCDLWSCGVILYIMLCGVPPFTGENDDEIYCSVKRGKINFDEEEWDYVSNDAKDLIKKLLTIDIKKRFSAKEALNHPWIVNMKNQGEKLDKNILLQAVENLRKYSANQKLQQATLAYIVHNLTKKEDTDNLRRIFINFDDNGDGRLTKDELIKGLNLILNEEESEKEVNRLMDIIDVDGNGFIEYEEFLRAGLDKKVILTEDNLKTAFQMFDINHRDKINSKELGQVLGRGDTNVNDNVWKELIDEADLNKDGEVDYYEFTKLMDKC
jgi:calcium-dependent protein kinase